MAVEKDFRFSVRNGSSIPLDSNLNFYELGLDYQDADKPKLYTKTINGVREVAAGDANTLDGFDSTQFARTDINDGGIEGAAEVFEFGLRVNGILWATAQQAKYADIAEYYETDVEYEPGDILMIGSDTESTVADGSMPIMGVCSTAPAYLMNTQIEALVDEDDKKLVDHFAPIALKGRVPVKITGSAKRGDYIVIDSKNPGKGKVSKTYPKTNPDKVLVGICITAGKGTCEVKV